jgi:predicted RNase H-like HicB family nuclease
MKYGIIIEKTRTGFSAWSPDLEGCVAAARTRVGVLRSIQKAIRFHLEGLRLAGRRIPRPASDLAWVEVPRP